MVVMPSNDLYPEIEMDLAALGLYLNPEVHWNAYRAPENGSDVYLITKHLKDLILQATFATPPVADNQFSDEELAKVEAAFEIVPHSDAPSISLRELNDMLADCGEDDAVIIVASPGQMVSMQILRGSLAITSDEIMRRVGIREGDCWMEIGESEDYDPGDLYGVLNYMRSWWTGAGMRQVVNPPFQILVV